MSKGLTIIDKDYTQWVENLSVRYRQSQIKAAVRVNRELLKYYWELGRDIEEMHVEERWGQSVIKMGHNLRKTLLKLSHSLWDN